MSKYIIKGNILPENTNFTIERCEYQICIDHPEFNVLENIRVRFSNSLLYGEMNSCINYSKNQKCNLETLKNLLQVRIQTIIDIYCYVKSYSYDLQITKIINIEYGIDYSPNVRGELNVNKDQTQTDREFTQISSLFINPKYQFIADILADFNRGIKYPGMTGSYCYRAIETLRISYFENPADKDYNRRRTAGWDKMNDLLKLKTDFYCSIKDFADQNRHGRYPAITYIQREKIMNKTRKVIDKFIVFIQTKEQEKDL